MAETTQPFLFSIFFQIIIIYIILLELSHLVVLSLSRGRMNLEKIYLALLKTLVFSDQSMDDTF